MVSNVVQQQVPEGYQQSEVGIIPNDWELVPFGNMITELKGGANLTPNDYVTDGIPVIPKSGVTWGGLLKIREKDRQFCRLNLKNKYRTNMVDKNSTIIVLRDLVPSGPNIGLIVSIEDDEEYILAQGVYGFKFKPEYRADFIAQLSNSAGYRKLMQSVLVGSTQVHIRSSTLKETCLGVPPTIIEQTAIANALSDVDALITSLEKLIAKKRAIKTAAMQQLLTGKKRLPPFDTLNLKDGKPVYKQTELGEIPEDWEVVLLGELCAFENGDRSSNYPSPGSFTDSGIPFVNAGHVSKGKIGMKDMNYITLETYDRLGGGKVKPGDIVFCLRGSLGKYGIVEEDFGRGAIASSMVIIRANTKKTSLEFLKCYFDSSLCESMIDLWAGGAAQPNLGAQEMAKFSVPLPRDIGEQKVVACFLSDMDKETSALEQRLTKTKQLKQGMMQELLTGRTRLV